MILTQNWQLSWNFDSSENFDFTWAKKEKKKEIFTKQSFHLYFQLAEMGFHNKRKKKKHFVSYVWKNKGN